MDKAIIVTLIAGLLICIPAHAGDKKTRNAALVGGGVGLVTGGVSGAAKGAVLGGGVGLVTGGVSGAAKGALYGGATGAVTGRYKDKK